MAKDWFKKEAVDFNKDAERWGARMRNFVSDAYGAGEASTLMSDAGFTNYTDNKPQTNIKNWIANRLQRLNDLVKRADTLPMQKGFDPETYHWRDQ